MTNILIVDDDINILKLVAIHLFEQGYKVFQAKDGMEALGILRNEACDLALSRCDDAIYGWLCTNERNSKTV